MCPNAAMAPPQTSQTMVQIVRCLTQGDKSVIDDNWLLLDPCSTISYIKNIGSVHDIKTCTPEVETNSGHKDYNQIVTLYLLPFTVYVNKDSIAKHFSLKDVAETFKKVTMYTISEKAMRVHVSEQKTFCVKECGDGLYHLNIKEPDIVLVTEETKQHFYQL